MEQLKQNIQQVMAYVTANANNPHVATVTERCFSELQQTLEISNAQFVPGLEKEWLDLSGFSNEKQKIYRRALRQLEDVYRFGKISFQNKFRLPLPEKLDLIKDYLADTGEMYTEKHQQNIKTRCTSFLRFLYMERNVLTPADITYDDILAYYDGPMQSRVNVSISNLKPVLLKFLEWMSAHHLCPLGFSLVFYFRNRYRIPDLSLLSDEEMAMLKNSGNATNKEFSPSYIYSQSASFLSLLKDSGYAETMIHTAQGVLDALFLFLDMNSLCFSTILAWKWFELIGKCFGSNILMVRRILALFNDWILIGEVNFKTVYTYHDPARNSLPEWCRKVMYEFLELKRREGKSSSSVCMYRSSIVRFCRFLCESGVEDFMQLNADHLKQFNLSDQHETTDGKNAYNVRIRKFILYLADQGLISNRSIAFSLSCVSAPKTRIVRVLSPDEKDFLENSRFEKDEGLHLRNRAMLLIGLRMGMRASDIVSLKLEQIDWKHQCIHFVQQKTGVGKTLPFPVAVGNALFLYLTQGRPDSRSGFVFITHKAPYDKLSRCACTDIMEKAFPDPGSRPGGFHITRKTYATERLRNSCGISQVADLLGHRGTHTVHKYLSLDEERMRLCPFSLSESGISFVGGFSE